MAICGWSEMLICSVMLIINWIYIRSADGERETVDDRYDKRRSMRDMGHGRPRRRYIVVVELSICVLWCSTVLWLLLLLLNCLLMIGVGWKEKRDKKGGGGAIKRILGGLGAIGMFVNKRGRKQFQRELYFFYRFWNLTEIIWDSRFFLHLLTSSNY